MAKEDKNQNLLIIAIVGIVAIVALMIFSRGGTGQALTQSQELSIQKMPGGPGDYGSDYNNEYRGCKAIGCFWTSWRNEDGTIGHKCMC